jgi:6-phosphogluconolactonase
LPIFYGINELDSTITVYSLNSEAGTCSPLQNISTLPPHFADESTCADVHVSADGRYVYGSNRGHDSLAVFRVWEDGCLETIGHVSTQGRKPRNFTLIPDTDYVLVANQDTDSIMVMRVEEGLPVATGERCQISKPVCLKTLISS